MTLVHVKFVLLNYETFQKSVLVSDSYRAVEVVEKRLLQSEALDSSNTRDCVICDLEAQYKLKLEKPYCPLECFINIYSNWYYDVVSCNIWCSRIPMK